MLLCALAVWSGARGQSGAPEPITEDELEWFSPPGNPLLQGAWVLGAEQEAGIYVLRVVLSDGGRIPPHAHPDTRNATVLSGILHVGFGNTFEESNMVAMPAGTVYVVPANVSHYLWAQDGDATYQESGVGPTANLGVED
jgi:quercetin dioxygenase-like cupin family protein